jgi:hypothetical protein
MNRRLKMKKLITIICLLLLANAAIAVYKVQPQELTFNKEFFSEIRLKVSKKLLSRETREIFKNGKYIIVKSTSQGEDRDNEAFNRNMLTYYSMKNDLISVTTHRVDISKESRPFTTTQIDFDWDRMKALFTMRDHESDKTTKKKIKLTKKTILAQASALYFQSLIEKRIAKDNFVMIIPNGNTYKMKVKISYEPEKLEISDKKLACYKIEMKPDLGFLSLVIPTLNFWFDSSAPYNFVRYEGPENGPMSPTIVQEVVN